MAAGRNEQIIYRGSETFFGRGFYMPSSDHMSPGQMKATAEELESEALRGKHDGHPERMAALARRAQYLSQTAALQSEGK